MGPIEEIGLLKMDFLGLRNLDVIEDAVEIIERSRGAEIEIEAIPLDDAKTFEMLSRGDSIGVFQLESDGMRDALRRVRPTDFNDIVALVSLYRPGAMRFIDDYASGKRDPASVRYADPRLRPITESTYGCCIYQEQLMEIAKQMAGFSPAEADDLRKAVGKKKRDLMAQMRDKFLAGLAESGTDRAGRPGPLVADDRGRRLLLQSQSHAACYALIAYRTAFLRANYPAEYMAAVISSVMSTKDKVPFFVNRCEEMEIEVLPPDVNSSDHGFVVSGKSIRFGLDAVKNVGHQAVEAIIAARESRRPVLVDLGLLRSGRCAGRQQAGGRVPDQVWGARLVGRHPQGNARGAVRGPGERLEVPGGRAARPGLDLRPRRRAGRQRGERGGRAGRSPAAGSRPTSSTSVSCCGSRRRPSGPSSPRTRWPRFAMRCANGWTARSTRRSARRTAPGSRWAGSSARASACEPAAAPM